MSIIAPGLRLSKQADLRDSLGETLPNGSRLPEVRYFPPQTRGVFFQVAQIGFAPER